MMRRKKENTESEKGEENGERKRKGGRGTNGKPTHERWVRGREGVCV